MSQIQELCLSILPEFAGDILPIFSLFCEIVHYNKLCMFKLSSFTCCHQGKRKVIRDKYIPSSIFCLDFYFVPKIMEIVVKHMLLIINFFRFRTIRQAIIENRPAAQNTKGKPF